MHEWCIHFPCPSFSLTLRAGVVYKAKVHLVGFVAPKAKKPPVCFGMEASVANLRFGPGPCQNVIFHFFDSRMAHSTAGLGWAKGPEQGSTAIGHKWKTLYSLVKPWCLGYGYGVMGSCRSIGFSLIGKIERLNIPDILLHG